MCDTQQPVVFILGDSISCDYTAAVQRELDDIAIVSRKNPSGGYNDCSLIGRNGGNSQDVIEWLQYALKERQVTNVDPHEEGSISDSMAETTDTSQTPLPAKVDVLVLNCGLWDVRRETEQSPCRFSHEEYKNNLELIFDLAKEVVGNTGITLWVSTTPVHDETHNRKCKAFNRYEADVQRYNTLAREVCCARRIEVVDLYAETVNIGSQKPLFRDHVHFFGDVSKQQGNFVASSIRAVLQRMLE
eukprot:TRINITY_DN49643_c0_g1_i1.p1 TRINITY_DN49643_c0_g1~~TRINITY_DN49643_c0_g1_i1.p1  ORF type:complete len:245 (+),score=18.83 TRINITY_DN49643_c0_g1_i1:55-789(+)